MENKYYTPSIEEFFVGFEYEIASYGGKMLPGAPIIKEWIQDKLTSDLYDINYILDIYNEGKQCTDIRVKYLDASDIEELGFVKTKYCSVPCYEKDCWRIFWFEGNMISIEKFYKEEKEQYFRGWIKNKSELKKVLNMLNIK